MNPQVQHDEMQQGEKSLSSTEGQHPLPLMKERPKISLLLRILSIEVALIGGFLIGAFPDWGLQILIVGAVIASLLFRSPWALLVVPAAFTAGYELGYRLPPLLQGGWPAYHAWTTERSPLAEAYGFSLLFLPMLVLGITVLCTLIELAIEYSIRERRKPPISDGEQAMSPELSTATSAVRKPGLLPRFWLWRIAALLLVVVPLTAAAVSWQRIFPPLPADCGQPANAVRSGAVAQYCFFKRLPQFGQSSMTAGPDGSIWSTEWSKIARITPDGTLTEFPASSNGQIITGPDGNLWFTTTSPEGNTKLVRMNPHGNIEVFTKSPDVPVGPMIVGPDGRLWTVSGGVTGGPHALAKITLTGTVTVLPYPLPDQMQKEEDPESGITDLASGSDGNVWFVETVYFTGPENGIVFGRITPSGAVTIFPTVLERGSGPPLGGGSGSRKGALAAGRDGNLWFLGYEGQISRITPKGTVTRFRVPEQTVQENPLIIAGPDGNVWFSAGRGKIGRITPSGAVTLFPLSQQAQIGALAAGPDGHIWFLRSDNTMSGYGWWTQIGRITP